MYFWSLEPQKIRNVQLAVVKADYHSVVQVGFNFFFFSQLPTVKFKNISSIFCVLQEVAQVYVLYFR
jgi:hypothetical protein